MPACCGSKYYGWPDSYARFIQYIWSRYQANNTVLSPIHLDIISETRRPGRLHLAAIESSWRNSDRRPFGTLLSANANPVDAGELGRRILGHAAPDRQHARAQQLLVPDRDLPLSRIPSPALNGEPYYSGYMDARGLGGGAATSSAPRAAPKRTISSCVPPCTAAFSPAAWRARLRSRGNLGRGYRAGSADQNVGRVPVELRQHRCSTCARLRSRSASATRN